MHYIVLDFEWNQPLSEKEMLMEPFPFDSEIIEIGAVKLDESFQTVDEFKTFIRPQFYPHLSNAVVQLTKIRPQELEKAPSFSEAFDAFIDWCGDDCALCSWGPDDIPVLLDFWAPWCGPCRAVGPIIDELAAEYEGKVRIVKMNVDENPATPTKFGIRAIPTLMLFKNGQAIDQVTGAVNKDAIVNILQTKALA